MTTLTYILSAWFLFVTLVYIHAWCDLNEYHFDIVKKLTELKEVFTQEE